MWREPPTPHKRSPGKLERKKARNYVYNNSVSAHSNHDPDEVRERIFTGTSEEAAKAVLSELKDQRSGFIPEYPQGLVFHDSKGEGFFDFNKTD